MRTVGRRGVEIGARAKPHQAAIAVLARGEQHDARPALAHGPAAVVLVGEVDAERAADDRLDAGARHFLGEFQRAEHVVGVGQRQRRLAVFFGELRQARDGQRALKQRIGRMNVQMHEAGVGRHIDQYSRLAILRGASMRDRKRWSPSPRRASCTAAHRKFMPAHSRSQNGVACRGHPRLNRCENKTWMAGTSPAMTA